jgi:hypothetical protein
VAPSPDPSNLVGGWYLAGADGSYTPSESAASAVTVGTSDVPGIDVTLPAGVAISGTIAEPDGSTPVAWTWVGACHVGGGWCIGYAQTDANGGYTTGPLVPGDYRVQVQAPSPNPSNLVGGWYLAGADGNYTPSESAASAVTVGTSDVPGIDVTLPVRSPATSLRIVGLPGSAVANQAFSFEVLAVDALGNRDYGYFGWPDLTGSSPGCGTSAPFQAPVLNGLATITGFACSVVGPATITVDTADLEPDSGIVQITPAVQPTFHVVFTQQPLGATVGAMPVGTAGSAWPIQPAVAITNSAGQILASDSATRVSLSIAPGTPTSGGPGVLSCTNGNTRTVAAGVAMFTGCSISAPGTGYQLRTTVVSSSTVPVGITGDSLYFAIAAAGPRIRGRITDEAVNGLSGATVYAFSATGGSGWATVDPNGSYTSDALPPGDYKIVVFSPDGSSLASGYYSRDLPGHWTADKDAATPVTLPSTGAGPSGVDVTLPPGYVVDGLITDAGGNPVPNAYVLVCPSSVEPLSASADRIEPATTWYDLRCSQSVTESDGLYLTGPLADDDYRVQISAPAGETSFAGWYSTDAPGHFVYGSLEASTVPLEGADLTLATVRLPAGSPPGDTPAGSGVGVTPVDPLTGTMPATLTFGNVTEAGLTSVVVSSTGPTPSGFSLGDPPRYVEITTTATFTGSVAVCLDYTGITFPGGSPALFHHANGVWTDITTSVDPIAKVVCGTTDSLSPFVLGQPDRPAPAPTPVPTPPPAAAPIPAAQAITFTLPVSGLVGSTVSLAGTASSGLAVTYTSGTPAVCTVAGSTLTLVATGTCTVTASQPGNGTTWAAGTPVTASMTVTAVPVSRARTVLTQEITVDGRAILGAVTGVLWRATVVDRLSTTRSLAGSIVELWWRPAGSTWRKLTNRRIDVTGHATYRFTATRDAAYRWRFTGSATQTGAWSTPVTIRVR